MNNRVVKPFWATFLLSLLLGLSFYYPSQAQKIDNIDFTSNDKEIWITYDLSGNNNQTFEIRVYLSKDGGLNWDGPLKQVSGDVGKNIQPGASKKITWDVLKEKGSLIGSITFKVEGTPEVFSTPPVPVATNSFIDERDGTTYPLVQIGHQTWMAQNLRYQMVNEFRCYNNRPENCEQYGCLYSWFTVANQNKPICPKGWHVPSDQEWNNLTSGLGDQPAMKLKSRSGWADAGQNQSGLNMLPGGYAKDNTTFVGEGNQANFWTADKYSAATAYSRTIVSGKTEVFRRSSDMTYQLSVRCIKD